MPRVRPRQRRMVSPESRRFDDSRLDCQDAEKITKITMRIIVSIILMVTLLAACSSRQENAGRGAKLFSAANTPAVNINSAPADELERLPDIGPKTAEAIVEFRVKNGPFRRVEHLMQIRGVSEERFRAIRHLIRAE